MAYVQSQNPRILYAEKVIEDTYGDTVSVDSKKKALIKFGRNLQVGTASTGYTLWATGGDEANETYVAANTNSIDTLSSDEAVDGQQIQIEGHTESGGNKTFVVQTATINGTSKVTLSTALNRVTRVANIDGTEMTGNLYVYEDTAITTGKPTDTTKIHLTVRAGRQQSEKASTSLSSNDYWIITGISAGYLTKSGSNTVEVELQVRESGGVFRPKAKPIVIGTGTQAFENFDPYIIVPKNADVRLVAIASASGQSVTGDIKGYLAEII